MCLPCPDNPLMNASSDAVELKLGEADAESLATTAPHAASCCSTRAKNNPTIELRMMSCS
jgi:hypothetical protein